MGGDGLGLAGSRSEFLPESYSDHIQYQRKGGCFVTTKKGVLFVISSFILAICAGLLVYYMLPCGGRKHDDSINDDETLASLKTIVENQKSNQNEERSKLKQDIRPLYYRLRMHPHLDEYTPKNFSFEGHVTIVLQNHGSLSYSIALHAKNLTISATDVILSYTTTSKVGQIVPESQIKEDANNTNIENNLERNITSPIELTPDANATIEATEVKQHEESAVPETTQIPTEIKDSTVSPASEVEIPETTKVEIPKEEPQTPKIEVKEELTSPSSSSSSSASFSPPPSSSTSTTTSTPPVVPNVIQESKKNVIKIIGHKYNESAEQFIMHLEEPLEKDMNYTLEIPFSGFLQNNPEGFMLSKYKDSETGLNSWLATTLLKPAFARSTFPCFDEPSLKAKFEISIARRTNVSTLSNMPLHDTSELMEGWVWDHFEITPPMSPYLVSLTVSNFQAVKASSNILGTAINIVGRKDIVEKATYLLDITPKILKFYSDHFQTSYPLSKIDIIAVPELPFDSYESWGVVYIREDIVLVNTDSSLIEKEKLIKSVAKELGKQWLGNFVTMKSWKESWITEGISQYLSYSGISDTESSWDIYDELFLNNQQEVLEEDGLSINDKLSSVNVAYLQDDIHDIYTKKSVSIMKMLHVGLTDEIFNEGIKTFIERWKFDHADSKEIWNEISKGKKFGNGITVDVFIESWENQIGYPLILVTRDYDKDTALLKQVSFGNVSESSVRWNLPVKYKSSENGDVEVVWLNQKTDSTVLQKIAKDSWFLLNVDRTTLCRVNYDTRNWDLLIENLQDNTESLNPVNRAMLLDDAFHLAKVGIISYEVPLNMSTYLMKQENNYLPWKIFFENYQYLDSMFYKSSHYEYIQDYVTKLISRIYSKVTVNMTNEDSYSATQLRKLIVHWACKLNYKECVHWAFKEYQIWANMSNPDEVNPISKTLRSTVYCIGVQMQGRKAFDFLWSRFLNASSSAERNALMFGMGCSTETWILIRYLQKSLKYSNESPYNTVKMWESLSTDQSFNIAFEFLKDNWPVIHKSYGNQTLLKKIVKHTLSRLSSNTNLEEIKIFINKNVQDLAPYSQDIILILKNIEMKLKWIENQMPTILKWLQNQPTDN